MLCRIVCCKYYIFCYSICVQSISNVRSMTAPLLYLANEDEYTTKTEVDSFNIAKEKGVASKDNIVNPPLGNVMIYLLICVFSINK